jgi:alkylated DNA nucleotide flippase Atl1
MVFQPKGPTALWKICYQVFQKAPVGKLITYQVLAKALGMNAKGDLARIQAAARRAGQELLRKDDRAVEAVDTEGYRIVSAARQISLATGQVERATTALDRGRDLTTHVRLDELSDTEQKLVMAMSAGFAQVAQYARQIGRRIEDHEHRLNDVEEELRRLREERSEKS